MADSTWVRGAPACFNLRSQISPVYDVGIVENFKDLSLGRQALALALFAVSLGVVAAAQRDLLRRPDAQIHGDKLLWRLVGLNAVGAGAYFRWGRR